MADFIKMDVANKQIIWPVKIHWSFVDILLVSEGKSSSLTPAAKVLVNSRESKLYVGHKRVSF
jgi:hypothetical protein